MGERRELAATLKEALAIQVQGEPGEDGPKRTSGPRRPTGEDAFRLTHGFHTWPAGLHPDAAALLLGLVPEGPVADPFCGGGTVLVEAFAAGRRCWGRDLSPIAVLVSRVRTRRVSPEVLTAFRSAARKAAALARTAQDLPPPDRLVVLGAWYEEHVLRELESLRRSCVDAPEPVRTLLLGTFSSILVKASQRSSDTVARREDRRRPPGTTAVLFHKKARELARRLDELAAAVPPDAPEPEIQSGDARSFRAPVPLAGVVTSPPYPGIYDYLPMQHLRHVWLGLRPDQESSREMGSRRAFRNDVARARTLWREDTDRWLKKAAAALGSGGRLAVVIGDGSAGPRTIGTADPLAEAGTAAGLLLLARATAERPGPPGRRRFEHVLLFERK